jgi:chromosomal replication initiator protein
MHPLTDRKSHVLDLRGFVELPENRSAVRAISGLARSVLRGKRPRVNLLVLHGQPGTGKTRLTNAVLGALAVASRTATGRAAPARELARSEGDLGFADPDLATCDFLVLEDVQHLPKSATNALCALCELIDKRQARRLALVVTANAGPARLPHLPRRLTSRLAAGLVVQLEPLRQASRRAIVESSARNVKLAPEALDWLAAQGGGLRGALGLLQNLAQTASAYPGPLDRQTVEQIVAGTGQPTSREGDLHGIIKRVCAAFDIASKELLGKSRLSRVLVPRQVAMYLAHTSGQLSLPRVGAAFDRDHTTVLHACRKVEESMRKDMKLNATVSQLRQELA